MPPYGARPPAKIPPRCPHTALVIILVREERMKIVEAPAAGPGTLVGKRGSECASGPYSGCGVKRYIYNTPPNKSH